MKNDKFVLHKEYFNILNVCSLKANPMSIEVDISEHFIAFCTRKTTKEHAGKHSMVRIRSLKRTLKKRPNILTGPSSICAELYIKHGNIFAKLKKIKILLKSIGTT